MHAKEFITELIVLMFGITYVEYPASLQTPVYANLCAHGYGLGLSSINVDGIPHRYGMVILPKFCAVGYVSNPTSVWGSVPARVHLWSFSRQKVRQIDKYRDNRSQVKVRIINKGNTTWAYVRVPATIRPWQSNVLEIIKMAASISDRDCIVCLISGPPGIGKSTMPLLLDIGVSYINIMDSPKELADYEGAARRVAIVDEIDEIAAGVNNDKRAATFTKQEWNAAFDHIHRITVGPIVFLTSNNTYAELCEKAGEHAASMFRPGRIDIILQVENDLSVTVVRQHNAFLSTCRQGPFMDV